jgi:hypothetical protein
MLLDDHEQTSILTDSRAAAEARARRRRTICLYVGLLIATTSAAFLNSLKGAFVYDDLTQIEKNESFGDFSGHTLNYLMNHDFWSTVEAESDPDSVLSSYYRPVLSLSFAAAHTVAGSSPVRWHLILLALHIAATLMLFVLLTESLGLFTDYSLTNRTSISFFAALFFAVHPAQSESVAWVSDMGNPLSSLLILATVLCYLKFRKSGPRFLLVCSLLIFALAILSKEVAVVVVGILYCYEIFSLPRPVELNRSNSARHEAAWRELSGRLMLPLVRMAPFMIIVAAYMVLRRHALKAWLGRFVSANFPDDASLTLADNLRTAPSLLVHYLKTILYPADLSLIYNAGYVKSLTAIGFWIPLATVIAAFAVLVYISARIAAVRLAAIWMVLPLLPHLNTRVFPSEEIVQDHYLYLSIAGWGLLVSLAVFQMCSILGKSRAGRGFAFACMAAALSLSLLTVAQNRYWSSEEILWRDAAAHAPNSRIAHLELGRLDEAGGDLTSAMREYQAVLEINPDVEDGLNNAAFVFALQGNWQYAAMYFERIVTLTPNKAFGTSISPAPTQPWRDIRTRSTNWPRP